MEMTPISRPCSTTWQVSNASFRHQRHALLCRPAWLDADNLCRHDLADERLPGRLAKQDHLPCVVALGEDAVDLLLRPDEDGADVFVGHHAESVENGIAGLNGVDFGFPAQHVSYGGCHDQYLSLNCPRRQKPVTSHPRGDRDGCFRG